MWIPPGPADGPVLSYLAALERLDRAFPALGTDVHGVRRDERGIFHLDCLTE